MAEFARHQALYDALRASPTSVKDPIARRYYKNGLADREMPEDGDTLEWAAWVAGRRTRVDQGKP